MRFPVGFPVFVVRGRADLVELVLYQMKDIDGVSAFSRVCDVSFSPASPREAPVEQAVFVLDLVLSREGHIPSTFRLCAVSD